MPQGLQWILRDFQSVSIEGEAGTVPSIFLVVKFICSSWLALALAARSARWTICPLNNLAGLMIGKVYRGNQFASNYFVVALR